MVQTDKEALVNSYKTFCHDFEGSLWKLILNGLQLHHCHTCTCEENEGNIVNKRELFTSKNCSK